MVLKYLIEKEFKQMRRNEIIPRLILVFPCIMMLLMPWAANLEIKYNNVCVVDHDRSMTSRRLIEKVASTDYFNLVGDVATYEQAMQKIETGAADVILEIPENMEKNLTVGMPVQLQVSANSINGTKGGIGTSYLSSVIQSFVSELHPVESPVKLSSLYLYNPHLDYKRFMVPALMVMLLTMLCGFLPSLNIVSEKEMGTIEQLNVTPLSKFAFILAKLIPYWIVGLIVISLCCLLAILFYGIVPVGNLGVIYLFACVYVVVVSGFGLIVSNYSSTMQQAMFVEFFFIIVFLLLSGLFTPVRSMPEWAQWIARFNPLTYFVEVMRMVYLKGSGLADLWPQLIKLSGFMVVFGIWAVWSYRKTSV